MHTLKAAIKVHNIRCFKNRSPLSKKESGCAEVKGASHLK
ncbi:hypothetical protein B4107_3644 [Bacillus safensis]|nr:hypothetical protein B4107_3644 [Bacillus safensis]